MEVYYRCSSHRYSAFMVESLTTSGTFYLVEYDGTATAIDGFEDGWKCECPAFEHRIGHCKHITMMKPRRCRWDQIDKPSIVPVRDKNSRLTCPMCQSDVLAYPRPVTEDTPF